MKILLDECVTKRLKKHLEEFEVNTITELGWNGKKNGELISLCIEKKFEVFLTIDKNLIHQQNLKKYEIIIVVLNSRTSKIEELIKFIPSFKAQVKDFIRSGAYTINLP